MRLKIIPFGEIQAEVIKAVIDELRNAYGMVAEASPQMGLPKEFYNPLRHQYIAPQILDFLSKKFRGRVLAITDQDLYAEDLNFIFGQAQMRGSAAIVSICRLDPSFYRQPNNENLLVERAVKECVHEMGHVLGLGHCSDTSCVMSFSNTIFDVDRKTKDLCESCKLKLRL